MRYHRMFAASVAAAALITPLLAVSLPASAARQAPGTVAAGYKHGRSATQTPALPAPPRPPRSHPRLPARYQAPTALTHKRHAAGLARRAAAA